MSTTDLLWGPDVRCRRLLFRGLHRGTQQPWRRAYVILAPTASVPFHPRPAGA